MKRQTPVDLPQGYIDFFIALENLQNEQQILLAKTNQFETFDIKKIITSGNRPLIKMQGITINEDDYKSALLSIIRFMKANRPDTTTGMEKLEQVLGDLDIKPVVSKLAALEIDDFFAKLAEQVDLTPELVVFVFDHALRPFLRIYAAPYQDELVKDDTPFWRFPNICPVCGSKSHFSRIRSADDRRFMFCDRCFSEWESPFLQCVHCGNDNPTSIKYLNVENDDAYQLYVCDKCLGYLKTYDERQKKQITYLFIANMETIYLDLLAKEKGYTNHDE